MGVVFEAAGAVAAADWLAAGIAAIAAESELVVVHARALAARPLSPTQRTRTVIYVDPPRKLLQNRPP